MPAVTPDFLAMQLGEHEQDCKCGYCRLRAGGRKGGAAAGVARRERRRRYVANEMTTSERATYERDVLAKARRAGRAGGRKSQALLAASRHQPVESVEPDPT